MTLTTLFSLLALAMTCFVLGYLLCLVTLRSRLTSLEREIQRNQTMRSLRKAVLSLQSTCSQEFSKSQSSRETMESLDRNVGKLMNVLLRELQTPETGTLQGRPGVRMTVPNGPTGGPPTEFAPTS